MAACHVPAVADFTGIRTKERRVGTTLFAALDGIAALVLALIGELASRLTMLECDRGGVNGFVNGIAGGREVVENSEDARGVLLFP